VFITDPPHGTGAPGRVGNRHLGLRAEALAMHDFQLPGMARRRQSQSPGGCRATKARIERGVQVQREPVSRIAVVS
jgi:hypothetical protein